VNNELEKLRKDLAYTLPVCRSVNATKAAIFNVVFRIYEMNYIFANDG
jgi:hypothetical protein